MTEAYRSGYRPAVRKEVGKMRRVVGFVRVSTEDQGDGVSPEAQRDAIDTWCADNDGELVKVYEDVGQSGTEPNPATLAAVVEHVERDSSIAEVLVARLNRLGRNEARHWTFRDAIDLAGARLRSCSVLEPFVGGASSAERQMEGAAVGQAAGFSIDAGEAVKAAKRGHARRGRKASARVPFGWRKGPYRIDADGRPQRTGWVVEPAEAAVVRRIHAWYLDDGLRGTQIAKRLNAEDAPRKAGGGLWSDKTVLDVLDQETYSGVVVWNRQRKVGVGKRGRVVPVPESEWIVAPADTDWHPRILPSGTWERVRAVRRENAIPGRRPSRSAPFTGRLVCAGCGGPMSVRRSGRRFLVYGYRCTRYSKQGPQACPNPGRVGEFDLMRRVSVELHRRIETYSTDPDGQIAAAIVEAETRRQEAKQALSAEQARRRRVMTAMENGDLTAEEFSATTVAHRRKVRELEGIIDTAPDPEAERARFATIEQWAAFIEAAMGGAGRVVAGYDDPGEPDETGDADPEMSVRWVDALAVAGSVPATDGMFDSRAGWRRHVHANIESITVEGGQVAAIRWR